MHFSSPPSDAVSDLPFAAQREGELRRAAVYVRKSNKTEGKSKSLDEQVAYCRQMCDHHGFEVVDVYREAEGNKGDWYWDDGTGRFPAPYRPELTRLMADIAAGKIDVVVIWRSDRLYRDNGVSDALMKVFRAKDIRFFCGLRDVDVKSSGGLYQTAVEAASNRRWRDQISEDIQRDHQFKAEMGLFSRNPTCLGFRSKGRGTQEVAFIDEELALIRRVFRLFVLGEGQGPLGVTGIARLLMDEGTLWSKGRKGHRPKHLDKIYTSDIKTVLTNCMYVGRWRHKGREYACEKLLAPALDAQGRPTGERETVVPLALFTAAQEKLARSDRPGRRSTGSEHLLTGLAVCARCGRPLQVHYTRYKQAKGRDAGQERTPRANFTCNHRRGTRPCPPGSIRRLQEPVLNAWALEELAPLLVVEMEQMRASAGREADREALAESMRRLGAARAKETEQLAGLIGVLDTQQFGAVAARLRGEREALERQAGILQKRLEQAERHLPDLSGPALERLPVSALKDALSRALQWIAVGKDGIVLLTTWGSYLGAAYRQRDRDNPNEVINQIYLSAPTPAGALGCTGYLSDPAEFARGRRDSLGAKAERLSDAELLPGLLGVASEAGVAPSGYVLEADLPSDPAGAPLFREEWKKAI